MFKGSSRTAPGLQPSENSRVNIRRRIRKLSGKLYGVLQLGRFRRHETETVPWYPFVYPSTSLR